MARNCRWVCTTHGRMCGKTSERHDRHSHRMGSLRRGAFGRASAPKPVEKCVWRVSEAYQ